MKYQKKHQNKSVFLYQLICKFKRFCLIPDNFCAKFYFDEISLQALFHPTLAQIFPFNPIYQITHPLTLAGLYFKGVGTSQDYPRAFEWYTKAASKEYIPAMSLLGSMYFLGLGTARDYQLAAYWTRKAAEQGFADAQNNLAVLYGEGKGLPKDHLKAIEWLRKAANQQHSASLLTLGSIYANGLGVQRSFIVAYAMFTVAAVKDKLNAQFYLYTISQGMSKEEINSSITLSKEMLIKDNFLIALDHFTSSKNE